MKRNDLIKLNLTNDLVQSGFGLGDDAETAVLGDFVERGLVLHDGARAAIVGDVRVLPAVFAVFRLPSVPVAGISDAFRAVRGGGRQTVVPDAVDLFRAENIMVGDLAHGAVFAGPVGEVVPVIVLEGDDALVLVEHEELVDEDLEDVNLAVDVLGDAVHELSERLHVVLNDAVGTSQLFRDSVKSVLNCASSSVNAIRDGLRAARGVAQEIPCGAAFLLAIGDGLAFVGNVLGVIVFDFVEIILSARPPAFPVILGLLEEFVGLALEGHPQLLLLLLQGGHGVLALAVLDEIKDLTREPGNVSQASHDEVQNLARLALLVEPVDDVRRSPGVTPIARVTPAARIKGSAVRRARGFAGLGVFGVGDTQGAVFVVIVRLGISAIQRQVDVVGGIIKIESDVTLVSVLLAGPSAGDGFLLLFPVVLHFGRIFKRHSTDTGLLKVDAVVEKVILALVEIGKLVACVVVLATGKIHGSKCRGADNGDLTNFGI